MADTNSSSPPPQGPPQGPTAQGPGGEPPGGDERRGRRMIPGVAIASVIAGIVLVVLLLPRVLLYPQEPEPPPQPDWQAELAMLEAHNDALEEEVERLEGLLGAGICRLEDGTLNLPGANDPANPDPADPDPANPDPANPDPAAPDPGGSRSALPPEILSPQGATATPPGGGEPVPLTELLDSSVGLVLAFGQGGFSTGSAFAVAPGLLLTNRHVVEGASEIWVASQHLGEVRAVELAAASAAGTPGQRDYALLSFGSGGGLPPLALAPEAAATERLTSVVAAGFPSMLLQSDQEFRALVEGSATSIPNLVLTQGIVTVVQDQQGLPLVVHSAQVSPGNSGGPLVDLCGRVVGINTFVQSDQTAAHVNYALGSGDIAAFLAEAGVDTVSSGGPCLPQAATVAAAGEPEPSGAAEPGTADE